MACTLPCRRFANILANVRARLGADVGRYSFIVVDLHHLLLAGLPAHLCENSDATLTNSVFAEFSPVLSDQTPVNRENSL